MEHTSIKRKPAKINQNEPISNMVPKKDTSLLFTKRAEIKTTKTTAPPPSKEADRGKVILPSKNLAKLQKITEKASPITKRAPLESPIGMRIKGRKKNGNNTMTKKSDINESLSNIFERISLVYYAPTPNRKLKSK